MTLTHRVGTANLLFPPRPYPQPHMLHALSGVGEGGTWCGRASRQRPGLLGLVEEDGGYTPGNQPLAPNSPIKGGAGERRRHSFSFSSVLCFLLSMLRKRT